MINIEAISVASIKVINADMAKSQPLNLKTVRI
jgi:hypothetical protein